MNSSRLSSVFIAFFMILSVLISSGCIEMEEEPEETEDVLDDEKKESSDDVKEDTDTSDKDNQNGGNDLTNKDFRSFSTVPEMHEWIEDNEIEPEDENAIMVDGLLLDLGADEALGALRIIGAISSSDTLEDLTGESTIRSAGFLIDSNIINYFSEEDGLVQYSSIVLFTEIEVLPSFTLADIKGRLIDLDGVTSTNVHFPIIISDQETIEEDEGEYSDLDELVINRDEVVGEDILVPFTTRGYMTGVSLKDVLSWTGVGASLTNVPFDLGLYDLNSQGTFDPSVAYHTVVINPTYGDAENMFGRYVETKGYYLDWENLQNSVEAGFYDIEDPQVAASFAHNQTQESRFAALLFDIASAFVDMENIEFLPGIMFAYKIEELEPPNRKVEDMEIVHGLANTEHSLVVESRFDLATSIELVKVKMIVITPNGDITYREGLELEEPFGIFNHVNRVWLHDENVTFGDYRVEVYITSVYSLGFGRTSDSYNYTFSIQPETMVPGDTGGPTTSFWNEPIGFPQYARSLVDQGDSFAWSEQLYWYITPFETWTALETWDYSDVFYIEAEPDETIFVSISPRGTQDVHLRLLSSDFEELEKVEGENGTTIEISYHSADGGGYYIMVSYGNKDADDSSHWYDLSGFMTPYEDLWVGFYFGEFLVDGYMDSFDASDTYAFVNCYRGCGDSSTNQQTAIHYNTDEGNFDENLWFDISDAFTYIVFIIYLYDEDSADTDDFIDLDGTDSGDDGAAWTITLVYYYDSGEWIGDYSADLYTSQTVNGADDGYGGNSYNYEGTYGNAELTFDFGIYV